MEISHFYIMIKSEVGVDFDVPLHCACLCLSLHVHNHLLCCPISSIFSKFPCVRQMWSRKCVLKKKKNSGLQRRPEQIECLFVEHPRPRPRAMALECVLTSNLDCKSQGRPLLLVHKTASPTCQ